jgi:hypothetical protein
MTSQKSSSERRKILGSRKITYFLFKLIIVGLLIVFLSKYKPLILVLIFEVLDFFKTVLKQTIPFTPIDLEFIFGITVSYYYSPLYGILIFFLSVVNRTLLSCIQIRHMEKSVRHVPLYFLISILTFLNFFVAAFAMLVTNYILKYFLNYLKGDMSFNKSPYNFISFFLSMTSFYLINTIYYYFPILA